MSVFKHTSSRRPSALTDADYDHEIFLIDRTHESSIGPLSTRSRSQSVGSVDILTSSPADQSASRRDSDAGLRRKYTLREQLAKRQVSKFEAGREQHEAEAPSQNDDPVPEQLSPPTSAEEEPARGRTADSAPKRKSAQKELGAAIDVLYENQRGGFLCGLPLFGGRALGNLDPSPWTNIALKTSATDITNAQVPDPSWEWAWNNWKINHGDDVDEDGWEYSFAFYKKFSWHSAKWWNSFVRRRAWIRKRVKKHTGHHVQEGHMLNSDYFTIHPAILRDRNSSPASTQRETNYSVRQLARRDILQEIKEEILDIGALMKALKVCRIDREKTEAVENFIAHGGEDLYYLRERMHDIMAHFIFQASRRLLLAHLARLNDEATDHRKQLIDEGKEEDSLETRRIENLHAAIKHADEEVRRLEFWSDVKEMAHTGNTKGAVDVEQGWDESWTGLDNSGPKDVISDREISGNSENPKAQGS